MAVQEMIKTEVEQKIDSGDMSVINGVLSGNIKPVETMSEPVAAPEPIVESTEPTSEPTNTEPTSIVETKNTEEAELLRRRLEFETRKQNEEREQILREKVESERLYNEEKKAREIIENRLRDLEKSKEVKPTSEVSPDDEEYVSEYAKNTRKMLDDLREGKELPPKLREMDERLRLFEESQKDTKKRETESRQREENEKRNRQFNDEIENFRKGHPELVTKDNFETLKDKFFKFKNDLVYLEKATDPDKREEVLMDFFDPKSSSGIRDRAKANGITPPEDVDKFLKVIELIDAKNGIEWSPVEKRFVQKTDNFGNPITYGSIDEVYKLRNFDNLVLEAKKESARAIQNKLTEMNSSPSKLKNTETYVADGGMSEDQVEELINLDPRQYINDPETLGLVKRAFNSRGLPMPEYRGRRL